MYGQDEEEPGLPSSFEVYYSEAINLYKNAEYSKAVDCFTLALEVRMDDPNALVARSKCYLQMGEAEDALKDAEASLAVDNTFHRGLLAKAEALYYMSDFEMSLVFYHRGNKLRPELNEFFLGIQKAQEAIDNSVGTPDKVKLTTAGDLSFMQKQSEKELAKSTKMSLLKQIQDKQKPKPMVIANRKQEVTIKQLLGRLYGDREYLEKLLKETNQYPKTDLGKKVCDLCEEGIVYLDTRSDFWRQHKPIYSRKHDKMEMLKGRVPVDGRQQTASPNDYILGELDKIDRAQAANKHEESLNRAKRCLIIIEKYADGVIQNKHELVANLHSLMGNAYLDMGQFNNSLNHHKMDNDVGNKYDLEDVISRSLDNIGRVYARTGRFQQAIDTWSKKLPLCKSELEKTWLYHEIGRCFLELEDFDEAKEYGEMSLQAADNVDDNEWRLQATVLIAQSQVKLVNHRGAITTFTKALDIAQVIGDYSAQNAITKAIDEVNNKIVEGLMRESAGSGLELPDNLEDFEDQDLDEDEYEGEEEQGEEEDYPEGEGGDEGSVKDTSQRLTGRKSPTQSVKSTVDGDRDSQNTDKDASNADAIKSNPTSQPTSQPPSQPASQPGSKPASQPGSKPASQPGSQPTSRPAGALSDKSPKDTVVDDIGELDGGENRSLNNRSALSERRPKSVKSMKSNRSTKSNRSVKSNKSSRSHKSTREDKKLVWDDDVVVVRDIPDDGDKDDQDETKVSVCGEKASQDGMSIKSNDTKDASMREGSMKGDRLMREGSMRSSGKIRYMNCGRIPPTDEK